MAQVPADAGAALPALRRAAGLAVALLLIAATGAQAAQWRSLPSAKLPRTEVAAARIGPHAYLAGGFAPVGATGSTTTAVVERYDLRSGRVLQVRSMPVALNHAAAASWRGDLYVVGGYTARDNPVAALRRFDPERRRWTTLPPMPTARGALGAAVIGDRLYAIGGAARGQALTTLEIFDLRRRRWRSAPPMAVAREHLGVTAAGGRLYVLAGRPPNSQVAERYDPRVGAWERLPDMARERGGNAAATVRGKVVVVGGEENAGTISEVERFDPATRRWSALAPMRTPRHGLGAIGYGRRLFTLAGGPKPGLFYSRAVEALTLER